MRCIIPLLVALLFLSTPSVFAKTARYGKEITTVETTPISSILADPDRYIGTVVKIHGMVLDVCAKRGCWIYVAGDQQGEKIQVKVTDGEIVFPMEASGRMATVEGMVEELNVSREQMLQYLRHLAEEKGQPFDPATVKEERLIRLRGMGAEIEG